jgi:hypothetical protein
VTYPGDLDEYERNAEGQFIPSGFIVVNGYWGPPEGYAVFVPEVLYLDVLARLLTQEGFAAEGKRVSALRRSEIFT